MKNTWNNFEIDTREIPWQKYETGNLVSPVRRTAALQLRAQCVGANLLRSNGSFQGSTSLIYFLQVVVGYKRFGLLATSNAMI